MTKRDKNEAAILQGADRQTSSTQDASRSDKNYRDELNAKGSSRDQRPR